MDHSTPAFPVLHRLLEFAQSHGRRVDDAIQSSHPLVNSKCPINARYCSFCCLWEAWHVNTDSHFVSDFSDGSVVKDPPKCRSRRKHRFDAWVGKIPWRREWPPASVFLPGKSVNFPWAGRALWTQLPPPGCCCSSCSGHCSPGDRRRETVGPESLCQDDGAGAECRDAPQCFTPQSGVPRCRELRKSWGRALGPLPPAAGGSARRVLPPYIHVPEGKHPSRAHDRPGRQPWHMVLGTSVTSQVLAAPGPHVLLCNGRGCAPWRGAPRGHLCHGEPMERAQWEGVLLMEIQCINKKWMSVTLFCKDVNT